VLESSIKWPSQQRDPSSITIMTSWRDVSRTQVRPEKIVVSFSDFEVFGSSALHPSLCLDPVAYGIVSAFDNFVFLVSYANISHVLDVFAAFPSLPMAFEYDARLSLTNLFGSLRAPSNAYSSPCHIRC
jgi:hypothetical protein